MNIKKLLLLLIAIIFTFVGCSNAEPAKTEESLNALLDNINEQQTHINVSQNTEKKETIEPFDNESIGQADYSIYNFNGDDIMLQPWVFLNFSISNVILHFQTIYDFSFEEGLFEDGWELISSEGTVRNYEKVLNEEYSHMIKVDIRDGVCYEFSFKKPFNYMVYTITPHCFRSDARLTFGKPSYYAIDGTDIIDYYVHPTGRYLIQFRYRQALEYGDSSQAKSDIVSIKYFDESIIPELDALCMNNVTKLKEVY